MAEKLLVGEHCQCRRPRCGECGLEVRKQACIGAEGNDVLGSIADVTNSLTRLVEKIDFTEIKRAIGHLKKIHVDLDINEPESKESAIQHLCEMVGQGSVEPLEKLPELLGLEDEEVSDYREVLSRVRRLSHCVECTSPPGSPLEKIKYVLFSSGHELDSKSSPSSSPATTPIGSPLIWGMPND